MSIRARSETTMSGLKPAANRKLSAFFGLAVGPFLNRLCSEGDDIRVLPGRLLPQDAGVNGLLVPLQADWLGHERSIGIAISKMGIARAEINPDVAVRDHLIRLCRDPLGWDFHGDTSR